jgi:flagellar basal-body rod modification protein FlgD
LSTATNQATLADNFTSFLQLLTTQLKNQNPLDPLDTNQFTQQLVQFAQVEQQMKSNDQLSSLVTMEQTAQSTTALAYVGQTVVVDGSTAKLDGTATWTFSATKPSTASITIKDSTGQTAYTGSFAVQAGKNQFTWDGKDKNGKTWPSGNYTMTVAGVDASGQSTAISTQVEATVDSVDLSKTPPVLSINGADYGLDKVTKIVRPGA